MTNYAIDDGDGNRLTAGLQGEDHARKIAQEMANEQGETVYLYPIGEGEETAVPIPVEPMNKRTPQIATQEFCDWLDTTSFAGIIRPGEQWDTDVAWPSPETMEAARRCFDLFMAGQLAEAKAAMHAAQEPFV